MLHLFFLADDDSSVERAQEFRLAREACTYRDASTRFYRKHHSLIMFWPLILPAKITFWLLLAVIVCVTCLAPVPRLSRVQLFFGTLLVAVVAFIPSCVGVMAVLDARRFGDFEYASYDDVEDFRVERYLPPQARSIKLHKIPNGFRAMFQISEADVVAWHESIWSEYGTKDAFETERGPDESDTIAKEMMVHFEHLDWPLPQPEVAYYAPVGGNGATFKTWYDRDTNTAILWGCYW